MVDTGREKERDMTVSDFPFVFLVISFAQSVAVLPRCTYRRWSMMQAYN